MKDVKPLRIGIIGIGFWSMLVHVHAIKKSGRAELVSISRRTPDRLELARESLDISNAYTDWRELINNNELDAVVVSTAHSAHAEPVIAALEKGLHVLVEKPLAITGHEARKMVQAAEKAERVLMVGYDRRCKGLFRTMKSEIENGAIGTVRQVSVAFAQDYVGMFGGDYIPPGIVGFMASVGIPSGIFGDGSLNGYWRKESSDKGGGMFFDTGSHFVDLSLWLAGAEPKSAAAFMETTESSIEKYISVQAKLANGAHVSIISNGTLQGTGPSISMDLTIIGDSGIINCDGNEAWISKDGKREKIDVQLPDYSTIEAFIATIMDETPNLSPGLDAIRVVTLTEAAYRSAAECRIVMI
jgi:predicted dehydrogenase